MDRREVLDIWSKSRKMVNHPLLPQELKDKAKVAMDGADAILSLQDAQRRKLLRDLPPPAPETNDPPDTELLKLLGLDTTG